MRQTYGYQTCSAHFITKVISFPFQMDFIDPILSIASQIYTLVENVKANKKRCQRVSQRVKALEELVRSIRKREPGQTSAEVEKALKELSITLKSAQELIKKYTLANWVERILNSSSHVDEFQSVNERLNDAFQVLSGALQVEQGNMLYQVFELTCREKEDEVDQREDDKELKKCKFNSHRVNNGKQLYASAHPQCKEWMEPLDLKR